MSEVNVWDAVLSAIEKRINHESFTTWFKPIAFIAKDSDTIRLGVPDHVFEDWILNNYRDVVDESLEESGLSGCSIGFEVVNDFTKTNEAKGSAFKIAARSDAVSKSDIATPSAHKTPVAQPAMTMAISADSEISELPLNPRYSFETFVVGSCNHFANAAALAVADSPSKTYNPLYIYGGVGLGKTHLMCAIGHHVKYRNRHLRLAYISAEKFMNELINAIRYDQTIVFRDRYRSIDVLLIDDIQFIAGKERTQEEFFHTFNALYDGQKQIVISSDCPPREIPTLEERLHSRFEWGLIADLEPPDLETKVAILKRKAETTGFVIPDDVALFIAGRVKNNVRELEGSLIRLLAISSLRGIPISKDLARDAIRNIASEEEPRVITIEQIQRVVAGHYKLTVDQLVSKNNARQFAFPRQIAMYLCKKLTKHSYPEVGRAFRGKHHTTVIHSFEKIQSLSAADSGLQRLLFDLTESLQK